LLERHETTELMYTIQKFDSGRGEHWNTR